MKRNRARDVDMDQRHHDAGTHSAKWVRTQHFGNRYEPANYVWDQHARNQDALPACPGPDFTKRICKRCKQKKTKKGGRLLFSGSMFVCADCSRSKP